MKYLARSSEVKSNLPTHGFKWITINFFFDFRLAEEIGNSMEGLLRSLLLQLMEALPQTDDNEALRKSVLGYIQGQWYKLQQPSMDELSKAFRQVLKASRSGLFVLVDGLDEFSGNMMHLLDFLLSLRKYNNLKLCLASRPEAWIREMLGMLPSIHMSEHNEAGIHQYLSLTIDRFQPRLNVLKSLNIRDIIVDRAHGVFLWVYLAVEEILQACLHGATALEVETKLAFFPSDLEKLYQRILDRIPDDRRKEAAIMYEMVSSATFQVTLALLQSAVRFVALQLGLESPLPDIVDEEHFVRRFHSTMGGLLELAPLMPDLYCLIDDFKPGSLRVRLIHETVRSFTRQTQWSQGFAPERFGQLYPNHFWARISSKALLVGNIRSANTITSILSRVHGEHKTCEAFGQVVQHSSRDHSLLTLIPLLHHSIRYLPKIYEVGQSQPEADQLRNELNGIMRCRLASMHFALVADHWADGVRLPGSSLEHEVSDLIIAAGHTLFGYLRENEHRIKHLQDRQRDDLVMAAVFSCRQWGSRCIGEDISNRQRPGLHNLVDMILSYNQHYYTFHLAIFVILGFGPSTRYIHKLQEQLGPSPRRTWERAQVPEWNRENDIGPLFPSEDPLCLWACEYDTYPQESSDYSARLGVLESLGLDVNQTCPGGGNIINYLIGTHFCRHGSRIRGGAGCYLDLCGADIINKLAILERHGADFRVKGPFGTPLQALECRLDERSHMGGESLKTLWHKLGVLLRDMLKHKELKNHLPRPLPPKPLQYQRVNLDFERDCEVCHPPLFENPRPAPLPPSQPSTQQLSATRPLPSRIPRLRRSPLPRR